MYWSGPILVVVLRVQHPKKGYPQTKPTTSSSSWTLFLITIESFFQSKSGVVSMLMTPRTCWQNARETARRSAFRVWPFCSPTRTVGCLSLTVCPQVARSIRASIGGILISGAFSQKGGFVDSVAKWCLFVFLFLGKVPL